MLVILYTLLCIVCLFLIVLVLLQDSKAGGLTGFTGGGESLIGTSANAGVTKFTAYVAVSFLVLCVSIGMSQDNHSSVPDLGDASSLDAGKPADGDAKPADATPGEAKPADVTPADVTPADVIPGDAKPGDTKPSDAKPDVKPAGG